MNSSTVTYSFNRPAQGPQAPQVTSPQPPSRPPPPPPRPPQVPFPSPRATDGVIFLSNNLYVFHLKKLNNWMSFVLIVSFDFQDDVPAASTSAVPYISVQAPGASSLPPPVLPSSVPSQAVMKVTREIQTSFTWMNQTPLQVPEISVQKSDVATQTFCSWIPLGLRKCDS